MTKRKVFFDLSIFIQDLDSCGYTQEEVFVLGKYGAGKEDVEDRFFKFEYESKTTKYYYLRNGARELLQTMYADKNIKPYFFLLEERTFVFRLGRCLLRKCGLGDYCRVKNFLGKDSFVLEDGKLKLHGAFPVTKKELSWIVHTGLNISDGNCSVLTVDVTPFSFGEPHSRRYCYLSANICIYLIGFFTIPYGSRSKQSSDGKEDVSDYYPSISEQSGVSITVKDTFCTIYLVSGLEEAWSTNKLVSELVPSNLFLSIADDPFTDSKVARDYYRISRRQNCPVVHSEGFLMIHYGDETQREEYHARSITTSEVITSTFPDFCNGFEFLFSEGFQNRPKTVLIYTALLFRNLRNHKFEDIRRFAPLYLSGDTVERRFFTVCYEKNNVYDTKIFGIHNGAIELIQYLYQEDIDVHFVDAMDDEVLQYTVQEFLKSIGHADKYQESHVYGRAKLMDERGQSAKPELNWGSHNKHPAAVRRLMGGNYKISLDHLGFDRKRTWLILNLCHYSYTVRPDADSIIYVSGSDFTESSTLNFYEFSFMAQNTLVALLGFLDKCLYHPVRYVRFTVPEVRMERIDPESDDYYPKCSFKGTSMRRCHYKDGKEIAEILSDGKYRDCVAPGFTVNEDNFVSIFKKYYDEYYLNDKLRAEDILLQQHLLQRLGEEKYENYLLQEKQLEEKLSLITPERKGDHECAIC